VRSCCAECGQEILHFGGGPPPERCEDCVPETGSGSRLAEQLARNLHRLRGDTDLTGEELAKRAGFNDRQDVFGYEGNAAPEPGVIRALRFAHGLGASINQLTDRIYWNPGETARRPRERRPPSERLSGFFLVLAASEPVFDPVPTGAPVADRHEAAAIFGQNLRGARERRHLTQESLARAAGLSKAGLSLIERGIRETTIEVLLALAHSLEVTPESLLAGISWIPRPPCAVPRAGRCPATLSARLRRRDQALVGGRKDRQRDRRDPRHLAGRCLGRRASSTRARRRAALSQSTPEGRA
jgi:transcriptional regulator with XRE-family HTH domain